ncbi:MAG TPA: AAA family ATPase [Patescibacteria group bacterium]|nr:AAA family ATPase [Patescibacteria group bacterium]
MKIVGIGGLPRSGKDTLAELLIQSGYFGFSFGDFIREQAKLRHKDKPDPISVVNMTETSNWLRDAHGADVVLKEALKAFEEANQNKTYKGMVLFSVRAPVEVDWILEHQGEVIWVEASDQVRYDRSIKAQRAGESKLSLDEFKRQEDLQWKPQPGIPAEAQMNTSYVKEHATIILENNEDDLTAFFAKAKETLAKFIDH